jgi:hypothetical protein
VVRRHEPVAAEAQRLTDRYARYQCVLDALVDIDEEGPS